LQIIATKSLVIYSILELDRNLVMKTQEHAQIRQILQFELIGKEMGHDLQ
jgi:hypothetical protein